MNPVIIAGERKADKFAAVQLAFGQRIPVGESVIIPSREPKLLAVKGKGKAADRPKATEVITEESFYPAISTITKQDSNNLEEEEKTFGKSDYTLNDRTN